MSGYMAAGPGISGGLCPACRGLIRSGAPVIVCPSCKQPNHVECWQKKGGCSSIGCKGAAAPPPPQQTQAVNTGACPNCGYIYGPMETTCRRCASGAPPVTGNHARKQSKSPPGMIVLILLLVAITGGLIFYGITSSQGEANLEYKFEPGQIDRYQFNTDIKVENPAPLIGRGGTVTLSVRGNVARRVLDVLPNGSAKLEEKISDIERTCTPLSLDMMGGIPDHTIIYTLSKDGHVPVADAPDESEDRRQNLLFQSLDPESFSMGFKPATLPTTGVDVGDTWTEYAELPDGSMKIKITCTLLSDREKIGTLRVCKIEEKYSNAEEPKRGSLAKMTVSGSGTTYFSTEEGKVIKSETDLEVKRNVQLGKQMSSAGFPSEMKETMTVKAVQELVD